jgi:hypothetical protein
MATLALGFESSPSTLNISDKKVKNPQHFCPKPDVKGSLSLSQF